MPGQSIVLYFCGTVLILLISEYVHGYESESEVAKSCLTLRPPWTVAYQAPPSMGFSRQRYWSGLPFPSPEIFPTQGSNLGLPHSRQMLYCLSHQGSHLWVYSVTIFIVIIKLCLYVGLLQFCGVFLFFSFFILPFFFFSLFYNF